MIVQLNLPTTRSNNKIQRCTWRFTSFVLSLALVSGSAAGAEPDGGMTQMPETVSVSFVLEKASRNAAGAARVESILRSLDAVSTHPGSATISGRFTHDQFKKLFGVDLTSVPAENRGENDFGSSGGYVATKELPVPPELQDYVTSASVEPPARRLNE